MAIEESTTPAVADYPTDGPHKAALDKALEMFRTELETQEGYEDQGEREGVQFYYKPDEDPYGVPMVKGECVVEGCTSDQFMGVILLPGMRKRWDSRFESGMMLERYNRNLYTFYSTMYGLGWVVYGRDICGAQQNIRKKEGANEEIVILQTSVEEADLCPEQSGKTRATVTLSGWQLLPQGNDLKVTYIVKISLNGSMPAALVQKVAAEIPACTGKARDVFYKNGFAPYVSPVSADKEPKSKFQNEKFSDPGRYDAGTLEYRCSFVPAAGDEFEIKYDSDKMYAEGVQVQVEGDGVETNDDEKGTISVKCEKDGEQVAVIVTPR